MRVCSRVRYGLLACTLLLAGGCGAKLNYKKTITVESGETMEILLDDPVVNKATVTVKSLGSPINAYLVLQSNLEAAKKAVDSSQKPKELLASKEKTEEYTVDVEPGKKPFALLLTTTGKRAEVDVTVTGK